MNALGVRRTAKWLYKDILIQWVVQNYEDKMRWVAGRKVPIFVHLQGEKCLQVEVGRWSNKGKIVHVEILRLNDPKVKKAQYVSVNFRHFKIWELHHKTDLFYNTN